MVLGKLKSYIHRIKLDHFLTKHTKIKIKWIKDLNIRPEIIIIASQNPLHAKDFAFKLMVILQFIYSTSIAAHLAWN